MCAELLENTTLTLCVNMSPPTDKVPGTCRNSINIYRKKKLVYRHLSKTCLLVGEDLYSFLDFLPSLLWWSNKDVCLLVCRIVCVCVCVCVFPQWNSSWYAKCLELQICFHWCFTIMILAKPEKIFLTSGFAFYCIQIFIFIQISVLILCQFYTCNVLYKISYALSRKCTQSTGCTLKGEECTQS